MPLNALEKYADAASRSAGVVITRYSTSFGMACRLLGPAARHDIENIYALVRVADETVDGAAAGAGLDDAQIRRQLDRLEEETEDAIRTGYSTNMVVHAFAGTARRNGIDTDLTRPFFASMRADLTVAEHTPGTLETYIYGSAEVVGLMCLRVFLHMPGAVPGREKELAEAARRLGAAFQKVNFLRDLAADQRELGRSYLPGDGGFSEERKRALVADVRADLAAAEAGIVLLPPGARRAVELAHDLFSALVGRIDEAAAADLLVRRIRVPAWQKSGILLRVLARGASGRRAEA